MTWQRVAILGILVTGAVGSLAVGGSEELAYVFAGAAAGQGGYALSNGNGKKGNK